MSTRILIVEHGEQGSALAMADLIRNTFDAHVELTDPKTATKLVKGGDNYDVVIIDSRSQETAVDDTGRIPVCGAIPVVFVTEELNGQLLQKHKDLMCKPWTPTPVGGIIETLLSVMHPGYREAKGTP